MPLHIFSIPTYKKRGKVNRTIEELQYLQAEKTIIIDYETKQLLCFQDQIHQL